MFKRLLINLYHGFEIENIDDKEHLLSKTKTAKHLRLAVFVISLF